MASLANTNAALVRNMPKALTVVWHDGTDDVTDTFTDIPWAAELDDVAKDTPIYGRFRRTVHDPRRTDPSHRKEDRQEAQSDTLEYVAGTDVYQVSERDIDSVTQLLATVDGVANTTLVEDTDFEIHMTGSYSTPDAIRFLDGTRPDPGTQFQLDYQHRIVSVRQATPAFLTYRLTLHVRTEGAGTIVGPTSGYHYTATELGELLIEALMTQLDLMRGKHLTEGLKLHQTMPLPTVITSDSDRIARYFIDFRMSRDRDFEREKTQYVGRVDTRVKDDIQFE